VLLSLTHLSPPPLSQLANINLRNATFSPSTNRVPSHSRLYQFPDSPLVTIMDNNNDDNSNDDNSNDDNSNERRIVPFDPSSTDNANSNERALIAAPEPISVPPNWTFYQSPSRPPRPSSSAHSSSAHGDGTSSFDSDQNRQFLIDIHERSNLEMVHFLEDLVTREDAPDRQRRDQMIRHWCQFLFHAHHLVHQMADASRANGNPDWAGMEADIRRLALLLLSNLESSETGSNGYGDY
jgi:hypothetical protein